MLLTAVAGTETTARHRLPSLTTLLAPSPLNKSKIRKLNRFPPHRRAPQLLATTPVLTKGLGEQQNIFLPCQTLPLWLVAFLGSLLEHRRLRDSRRLITFLKMPLGKAEGPVMMARIQKTPPYPNLAMETAAKPRARQLRLQARARTMHIH